LEVYVLGEERAPHREYSTFQSMLCGGVEKNLKVVRIRHGKSRAHVGVKKKK